MTEVNTKILKISKKSGGDCFPLNSIYCALKMKLTCNMNEKDLSKLYRCTLCNHCRTASFNHSTREKVVCNNLITPHVAKISENINIYGNSHGAKTVYVEEKQEIMETILFKGCTPTHKAPEILESAENLLKNNGVKYSIINNETCCGNILFNLGDYESGLEAVRKNIEKFKAAGVKKIITICPGCYNAFNNYYKGQDGFHPEIILAVDLLKEPILTGEEYLIQDPCNAKEKADNVRRILPGSKNKSASPCCGAGAGVMAHDKQLASTKARKAVDGSREKIITYCPFCYLNMSSIRPDKVTDIYILLDDQNKVQQTSK